jgi:hypothetical protein
MSWSDTVFSSGSGTPSVAHRRGVGDRIGRLTLPLVRRNETLLLRPLVLLGLLLVLVAAPVGTAGAQSTERIRRFDVGITIEPDGQLLITEVIEYDFGTAARHGIIRRIPVRERYDDTHDRVLRLDDIEVDAGPDTPSAVERTSEAGEEHLRIGDPDRTITGAHTYEISYRVAGALNAFDDHVELYWDAVGTGWDVPIDRASVTVDAPAEPTSTACFAGAERSGAGCGERVVDGRRSTFAASSLGPGEGLTVAVGLPPGATAPPTPILQERWDAARAFAPTLPAVAASSSLLVLGVAGVGALGWRNGRDRRYVGSHVEEVFGNADGEVARVGLGGRTETPVEFVPPDGLRPGQMGTLVDEVAHPLDVTASIIDLATRGYLRIDELPPEGWPTAPDWALHRLRDAEGLLPFERLLFDGLFDSTHPHTVRISELKERFAPRLALVQDALYDDVATRGWFHTRPDHERRRWLAIGLGVAAVGAVATVAVAAGTSFGLVPIPVVLVGLLLAAVSRAMPHRTAKGTGVLRRVEGFRRFIMESERERARFAEQAHLFSEYLPYAVVFGATEQWARAFAGLDKGLPALGWYTSLDTFSMLHFTTAMNTFAVTTSGTLTAVPAASGGSGLGGGGFSGGGMGGGGGGSW